jgi:hypothetical protein
MNDIVCAFTPGSEKVEIEQEMISAATLYLASKANADLFLMEYERASNSTLDFPQALNYVDAALTNLEKARGKYAHARDLGHKVGYLEYKRQWFRNYNYGKSIAARKMHSGVADKVSNYLFNMDIVGIYSENVGNVDKILKTLEIIKRKLELSHTPAAEEVWRLVKEYSDATLFGNYATVMGGDILMLNGPPICDPYQ